MKLAQPVKIGAILIISLNLLLAFGAIWDFMRMAPAIRVIIEENQEPLHATERMLASLALGGAEDKAVRQQEFAAALKDLKASVPKKNDTAHIAMIEANYAAAFRGDTEALEATVAAIVQEGDVNRAATKQADVRARQLGYAGAWGVVFMAAALFAVAMAFLRAMNRNLLLPMEEIDDAISAFRSGDLLRRCAMKNPPAGVRRIFGNINELLDISMSVRKK